ncbi:hypothetical protein KRMM14A1004_04690 [Krasilnikovia sp. MM14-A1004]
MFSDWYDSVRQRELITSSSVRTDLDPTLRCTVLGQMRWDAIRSPGRIQSYAQLLDGWIMHLVANDRILDEIGVLDEGGHTVLPFEVANYGFSVESSLVDIAHRGFLFSSLPLRERDRLLVQAKIAEAGDDEVERRLDQYGVAHGVASLLQQAGVPAEDCARLAAAWQFWIDQERAGALRSRQARTLCDDAESLAAEDFHALPLRTPAGGFIRERIVSDATRDPHTRIRRRSLVYAEIAHLDASNLGDERADAMTLKSAFNRCYHRTIARSENAMLYLHEADGGARGLRRRIAEREARASHAAIFPAGYLELLGGMSAERWQQFMSQIRGELRQWWQSWDVQALQEIGDRLGRERHPDVGSRAEGRKAMTAFASIGGSAAGAFADPNLTGVTLGAGIGLLAWIVTEPGVEALGRALADRRQLYDLVEVWPGVSAN